MDWKKLLPPLLIILILSIVGAWLVIYFYPPENKQLGIELIKALIQIASVLILGQLVSMWIEEARYKRQKADEKMEHDRIRGEALNEFRKEIISKFIKTYSEAKKIRRLLRAKSLLPSTVQTSNTAEVLASIYDEQMQEVNKIQLELEAIKQEIKTSIETSSEVFTNPSNLKDHISSMESYLRKIVKEYEDNFRKFKGEPPSLSLDSLPRLNEFLEPLIEGSDFDKKFVNDYHLALKSIRGDILSVNTSNSSSLATK
jgi:hypothetical protein